MAKATSDSVVASSKLSLVFVAILSMCTSVKAEANFTLQVIRRITSDIYYNRDLAPTTCDSDSIITTYLINEERCVSDEELLNGTL